jgi:hypothetical protein
MIDRHIASPIPHAVALGREEALEQPRELLA